MEHARLVYQAAWKIEYQPSNRSNSADVFVFAFVFGSGQRV